MPKEILNRQQHQQRDLEASRLLDTNVNLLAIKLDRELKLGSTKNLDQNPTRLTGDTHEIVMNSPKAKAAAFAIATPNVLNDQHSTPFIPIKRVDDVEVALAVVPGAGEASVNNIRLSTVLRTPDGKVKEVPPDQSPASALEIKEALLHHLQRINAADDPFYVPPTPAQSSEDHARHMSRSSRDNKWVALKVLHEGIKQRTN